MYSVDENLVSQTLAGDRDAFGVLVHKYQDMVYTYAFQKVRNAADSQDITQEVFLRAYRHLYQLRHPHRFRSWLYTIMSNECNRWLTRVTKKRQREIALEDARDDALQIEPEHTVPTEGWEVALEQALSALPDDNRVAVSMFYMGDCSLKEISEFLGVSVNTVKGKLYRARQQLGNALSEHYGRFVKSHKLKGGFLMQLMEQIRHIPSPTMGFTWSSATITKTLFSLIMALCVLIGLIGGRGDSPKALSGNQIGLSPSDTSRLPIEATLYTPDRYSTRPSITGIPALSGKHLLADSNRAPTIQSRQSIDRRSISANLGAKNAKPQLPAVAVEGEDEKLIYSGRIVDSNGAPVGDAELRYAIRSYPIGGNVESEYSTYPDPKYVTRTGMDGIFRFEISPSKHRSMRFNSKNMLNRQHIAVTHPDHATWWQEFPFQSTADVEIQLQTSEIISGKVMNEAGQPIQNAEVLIRSLFRDDPMQEGTEGALMHNALPQPVKTDANGEFVLAGLSQGVAISLDVQASGYAKEMRYSVPVSAKRLEIRLKHEGRIEGRLTYAGSGKPVRSAMVSLWGIHPTVGWGQTPVNWCTGKYRLKNVAPGEYSLYLDNVPKGWTALPKEFITVAEGKTVSNVDLTLIRSGFITGRVTDQATNEPIANHPVRLNDAARPEDSQLSYHHTITDTTGVYRFDAAPGRALVHTNTPAGYQDIGWTERLDIGQVQRRVDVVEGETVTVDFQFSKGIKLAGRLLDENGEPVAGARITNVRERLKDYGRSDELGRFTVGGLRVGQELGLKAVHSALGLRETVEIEVQPDMPIEIRMKRYQRIKVSGRVIDREGKQMPLTNVHLMRWDHQRGMASDTIVAVTDDDGRFQEIELIVGDEYTIYVKLEGYRKAETETFIATAEMTQIADLVLLPAGGQFFIEGRVTDTSGEPVRGVQLSISQAGQNWSLRTDENGDYRFEDLSMAVVSTLHIHHPGHANHEFKILRTNQRHDFVLVKADGYLAGKVVNPDGQPIERAWVMVKAKEDSLSGYRHSPTSTDVHGEFELRRIKDPIVSLHVRNKKYRRTFDDIAANQRDLVFALTPADARPEPTPEEQAERSYFETCRERFNTLVNRPAPQLTVAEWLSGPPVSIEDLKGKTIALHFWTLNHKHHVRQISLLQILQEVYRDKGLVCVAICPAEAEIETIKRHIAEQSLSYSIGLDQPTAVVGAEGETFHQYAVGWGHQFVLINTAGQITGGTSEHDLEAQIQILLAD